MTTANTLVCMITLARSRGHLTRSLPGIRHPPTNNPVTDVTSTDIRCNVNGLSGSGIAILPVAAG